MKPIVAEGLVPGQTNSRAYSRRVGKYDLHLNEWRNISQHYNAVDNTVLVYRTKNDTTASARRVTEINTQKYKRDKSRSSNVTNENNCRGKILFCDKKIPSGRIESIVGCNRLSPCDYDPLYGNGTIDDLLG